MPPVVALITIAALLAVAGWLIWRRRSARPAPGQQDAAEGQANVAAIAMMQMMAQLVMAQAARCLVAVPQWAFPPCTVSEARAARSAALWGFRPSK